NPFFSPFVFVFLANREAGVLQWRPPFPETSKRSSRRWPFLITLLMDSVLSEISSSKRMLPKLMYANTLRIAVQKAKDSKVRFMRATIFLLLLLSSHFLFTLWDVLRDVQSFQSDYAIILRHLLAVINYRFHKRKKVFCFYICKRLKQASLRRVIVGLIQKKRYSEKSFRKILQEIFLKLLGEILEEGKISRKIIECLNAYLSEDGPNLNNQALKTHNSVKKFVFHCWLTTDDRSLKATLIIYVRLQLNLTRGSEDGTSLVEQLLDVVGRELDQSYIPPLACYGLISDSFLAFFNKLRSDANKEEKFGTLTSSQHELVQLAALACFLLLPVKKSIMFILGRIFLTYWFSFERQMLHSCCLEILAETRHSKYGDSTYGTSNALKRDIKLPTRLRAVNDLNFPLEIVQVA
ncbi:hypothetical protein V2J09_015069, partial [Rumex salicifolius]